MPVFLELLAERPESLLAHADLAREAEGLGARLFQDIVRASTLDRGGEQ
jgi:hypothetical protein